MPATLIPASVRRRLAADPSVGGGNALQTAMSVSPDVDAPYLHAELPVRDPSGRARTELSLRELTGLVDAWSAWYTGRGVAARDRVGIYLRDSADDLIHYLAVTRLGAIPVLVNGELDAVIAMAHLRRAGVTGIQTDDLRLARVRPVLDPGTDHFWLFTATDATLARAGPARSPFRHAPGDPVLICHTSGTTGVPKPVIWTHGQMMAGIRDHLTRFPDRPASLVLSALPQSHAAAIGYAVLALLSGVPLAVMSDRRGPAVAAAADRYRATTVVGFAGTFADLALRGLDSARLDTVERWVSVGDASHHAHVAELVRRGRHWDAARPVPGSMFVDGFGASELGWGGILGLVTVPGATVPYRCIGTPQPFADVAVLRQDGTPAEPREVGLLAVKGPVVTPGYWNDSELTYRSTLNGFWLTGDLAYRDEAGRFYHMDRTADAIETAAGPVYSLLTEEIMLAHLPEIADCTVVGTTVGGHAHPIAVVRLRAGATADGLLARANEILAGLGGPALARLEVADTDEAIPVGVTGKVLKRQLRDRYAAAAPSQPAAPGGPGTTGVGADSSP